MIPLGIVLDPVIIRFPQPSLDEFPKTRNPALTWIPRCALLRIGEQGFDTRIGQLNKCGIYRIYNKSLT